MAVLLACDAAPTADFDTSPTANCGENERVLNGGCVACPSGATNVAGDDASGEDTTCDQDSCTEALGLTCERFEEAYLKASNPDEFDYFGGSVAVDGDTLVVGAVAEDGDPSGDPTSNTNPNSGAVYVFTRSGTTWRQEAYLKALNGDGTREGGSADSFGRSVDLDGDTLVVGAPDEDSAARGIGGDAFDNSASSSGAVYVFTRSETTWRQTAYIKASNADSGDYFGTSVALDGDTLAVGASGEDSASTGTAGDQDDEQAPAAGAVYVFRRSGGAWQQEAYIKASNTSREDFFGAVLALDGGTLAISALREGSAATGPNGDPSSEGAPESGAVYVFERSGAIWQEVAYLKASNTDASDFFGSSVALDGDTLAVGASWESSAATGVNGDQVDDSAPGAGAVYVFRRSEGTWRQEAYLKASNAENGDFFGGGLDLEGDVLVARARLESSTATGVGGDQTNNDANGSGAVYVFTRSDTAWIQRAYVKASNTGANDRFGYSLALSGDTLVIGARYESSGAAGVNGDQSNDDIRRSGAVYVRRLGL